jgi:hypothetical protein
MSHATGKLIAVILAVWLPLFSGSALAASVAMQASGGGHHSVVAQADESRSHCASGAQLNAHQEHLGANLDQSADHQDRQNSTADNCGTCHFACCGYLAAATLEMTQIQPPARLFAALSTQFQTLSPTPLDHPPLARA